MKVERGRAFAEAVRADELAEIVERLIEDAERNAAEQDAIIKKALAEARVDEQDDKLREREVDFGELQFKRVLGAGAYG